MTNTKGKAPLKELNDLQILSREAILEAADLTTDTVPVPEWGGAVKVRSFTKGEQIELRKSATVDGKVDTERLEMAMVIHGVIEPKLRREDIDALRGKAAGPVDRILKRILEISGLADDSVDNAEAAFQDGQ